MPVALKQVKIPDFGAPGPQPQIPAATFAHRAETAYRNAGRDWLVVYADREHIGNIVFLSGFEPRFEEAFLLLGPAGRRVLLTGNECESYAVVAGLPQLDVLVAQSLSLMAQDRSRYPKLADRFRDAGIKAGDSIGLAGWKYLEPEEGEDISEAFYVPAAYVNLLRQVVGRDAEIVDATPVLMHPTTGLRAIVDADQIAAYEWASARVSRCVWNVVTGAREGDDEYTALQRMGYAGEPFSMHPILASAAPGEALNGLRSTTGRRLSRGDGVTTGIGFWGALACRAGLFDRDNDAFLKVASAYFEGLLTWYATADIGAAGGVLHDAVVEKLAQGGLRSMLNPGHLTGHEEWMHSPVRPGSKEPIASGMPFQVDVIPTPVPIGAGLNCEDPVAFADKALRNEIAAKHPDCFARIEARRDFMRNELGADVSDNLLPLSSTPLCMPPFWMRADHLFVQA